MSDLGKSIGTSAVRTVGISPHARNTHQAVLRTLLGFRVVSGVLDKRTDLALELLLR